MEKNKLTNVRLTRKMAKLVGTVVLVDTLIVGLVSIGGHTPIYQDDKKIPQVTETIYVDYPDSQEIETNEFYHKDMDTRTKVVYYKPPYSVGKTRFREIETVIKDPTGPIRESRVVRVSPAMPDGDSYVETYVYDVDTSNYIVAKETLHDELLSDAALLMMLSIIDTGMICAGNSFIRREEEEEEKKL